MNEAETLQSIAQQLLTKLGVEARVEARQQGEGWVVAIETPDSALLIGRNGETLAALEVILRLLAYRQGLIDARVGVDINSYRRGREESLMSFVNEVAERVKSTGRAETLRPMSAYERRLVHEVVGQIEGLATESTGEGTDRRITIRPD